jgi:hypothetical protein
VFDVVLAAELMYYNTSVRSIVDSALALLGNRGVFLHAHTFRSGLQPYELVQTLSERHWSSLEINLEHVIGPDELSRHPMWRSVQCLITGPDETIAQLSPVIPARLFCPTEDERFDLLNIEL